MKKTLLLLLFLFINITGINSQTFSPILVDPPINTDMVELNVTLDWTDVAGAQYYDIEISVYPDFNELLSYILPQPSVSNFTFPNGVLSSNTKYYWRVRTMGSAGYSPFSTTFNFRTIGTPYEETNNLSVDITDLVNTDQLNNIQGNILINRLEAAKHQINLNHPFVACVHLGTFIFRVIMLENSNMISQDIRNKLINHAADIIELLGGDNPSVATNENIPVKFSLEQNYPNPFNPTTTIEYSIPEKGNVSLKIFDITGKEIVTLADKYQNAGSYIVTWNASNISSGVYFYRLENNGNTTTKRMILAK
ncbi:MAG: T9SS C-terminal target domain-containing protein [Ignavibacteriae bacterium]|nr:MAG: T9SS C-terminal target domain-containing protein [Ignavibacteriota bacterium]